MRIFTRGWAVLTMVCSIMLAANVVNAQDDAPFQYPIATQSSCNASGTSTTIIEGSLELDIPYEGTATFETIGNENTADGRASTQLVPVEFQGAGFAPEVGSVIWRADIDRTIADGLVSTITANGTDDALPATGRLQFHAEITLQSSKGDEDQVYYSETPVVMVDKNITVWPHQDTRYRQEGTVVFAHRDDPTRKIVVTHMSGIIIAQPPPFGPCTDPCCQTDALSLNTGFNYLTDAVYNIGNLDNYWTIIADENLTRPVPRRARVISRAAVWANPQPNTQWIGANPTAVDNFLGRVTYQKCFCLCKKSTLAFTMSILVDDQADIYVDGNLIGSTPDQAFGTPTKFAFTLTLAPGTHCIEVVVKNNFQSHAGVNIQGTVQGAGLLKYNCCGIQNFNNGPCYTSRLVLGTNATWTLASGPPEFGPYPRCATVITQPNGAWGIPITGSSWIGTNPKGTSRPWRPGPADQYTYRKCFCVDQTGTYTITISTMADDMVDVSLNGVGLFSYAGYTTRTTRTFIVALAKGCHCLEFRVRDAGWVVTGLDALVTIQGARLLTDECCDCARCTNPPSEPPDGLNPPELGMLGGQGSEGVAMDHHAPDMEARPMLLSIPDEATGKNMVHYVMDMDADAEVALFNNAGERVLVVDEGARTYGQHSVPLITDNLPAGSYRLQLVYGEHTLTVPVSVQ